MRWNSVLRQLLALVLCAAALPAAAQINHGFDAATPIHVVYRVDTTPPADAFTAGFRTLGRNEDLLALTSGVSCNTPNPIDGTTPNPIHGPAWVTMTADREQAVRFAQRYLESPQSNGPSRPTIYLYVIRADANFISVPGAFYSAIDAGFGDRAGYSPEHANALEYLLYSRPILGEQAVVASQVPPENIANATEMWLANGALTESGWTSANARFDHNAVTEAMIVVRDFRLPNLLPPNRILPAQPGASGTCAMTCDGATLASSFSLPEQIDYATQCSQSDAVAPLLFDIIND